MITFVRWRQWLRLRKVEVVEGVVYAEEVGEGVELRPELLIRRQLPATLDGDEVGNDSSSAHPSGSSTFLLRKVYTFREREERERRCSDRGFSPELFIYRTIGYN